VKKAVELYEKAIALDEHHTESWLGLADAYGFLGTTESMPGDEAWKKVVDYTHKALELSPEHPGVHYQLANLSFFTDCHYQEAMIHTDKSLEYRPGFPEARQFKAFLHILSGNMEEAFRHLQLALGVDPLNQETLFYKAYYYYRNGEITTAMEILSELLERNPRNIPAIMVYSYCLLAQGKYREVLDFMKSIPKEAVIPGEKLGIECLAFIHLGDKTQITKTLDALEKEAQNHMARQAHSYLFMARALMGQNDEAFAWLEKGLKMKSSILLLTFNEPIVSELKKDPRHAVYQQKIFGEGTHPAPDSKEKTALLDAPTSEKYLEKLYTFVEEEKPYLNPSLSLRSLAAQVDIHPNQLSWLLNEKTGKNFNAFINHYRIVHFQQLALDPDNRHISLIGLAYESGFNSKTVFNTFFKKETGMTPKAFLKSAEEKSSDL
jgi:AraC-like DNA-binding protein